ncbi:MAG: NUDIX hydrolase [Actinomycetota bacterium]|nr:NUDIX hydrolase [Actinomycetota bacterium]
MGSDASTAGRAPGAHAYQTRSSDLVFTGKVIQVRTDIVSMPGGGVSQRDVVVHPGAVGIVALDDADRIFLVHQYRHPVGDRLWELPAGLLDHAGEPALEAAARELAEEAGLTARVWAVLVDTYNSPGMSDEAVRIYLARAVHEIPAEQRYAGSDEEAEMASAWVPLDDAVRRVFRGEISNSMAVIGILAAVQARAEAFANLRPADARWPAKPSAGGRG